MDKNNRKLKILYKCIKANTSAIFFTYHKLKYSPPNCSKKQVPHKQAYLSENGGLKKKWSGGTLHADVLM